MASSHSFRLQLATLLFKRDSGKVYLWIFQNFQEYLPAEHIRMTSSVNFGRFSRSLLLQGTSGKLLIFSCTSCRIPTTRYNKKYFTSAFISFTSNIKSEEHPSFCSVFSYVLFCKNLIVLHHGDNNFLFYFDICIKFTLSTITSTMKKW